MANITDPFFKKKTNYFFFSNLLVFLIYIFGLKQNRFYIEPLLWFSFIFSSNIRIKPVFKSFDRIPKFNTNNSNGWA